MGLFINLKYCIIRIIIFLNFIYLFILKEMKGNFHCKKNKNNNPPANYGQGGTRPNPGERNLPTKANIRASKINCELLQILMIIFLMKNKRIYWKFGV
jgi:hypothetical protein